MRRKFPTRNRKTSNSTSNSKSRHPILFFAGNRERNRTENTNGNRHYLKSEKPKLFGTKTDLKNGRNGKFQCRPLGSVRTGGMFRAWPFWQVRLRVHMGSDAVKSNCFPLLQLILRQFTASFCELVLFTNTRRGASTFLAQF